MKILFIALCASLLATIVSCGATTSKDTENNREFVVIDDKELDLVGNAAEGNGKIRFKKQFLSSSDNVNLKLSFTVEKEGTVTLLSHGNEGLSNAVSLKFVRNENNLLLDLGDEHVEDLGIDSSGQINISVDVHNAETPTHVIVWNTHGNLGPEEASFNSASEHNHDHDHGDENHDSEKEDDHDHDHGAEEELEIVNGTGTFWGVSLEKAKLISGESGEAQYQE